MSSFNSQHNSAPISVTPILPLLLLSFPFFLAPSPHFISPSWPYVDKHVRFIASCISPRSCLCYIFARIAFFFFPFSGWTRSRSTSEQFFKLRLLRFGYRVTWIDFSRDISDHILSLWRDPICNPPECHALLCSKDNSHPAAVCLWAAV